MDDWKYVSDELRKSIIKSRNHQRNFIRLREIAQPTLTPVERAHLP